MAVRFRGSFIGKKAGLIMGNVTLPPFLLARLWLLVRCAVMRSAASCPMKVGEQLPCPGTEMLSLNSCLTKHLQSVTVISVSWNFD